MTRIILIASAQTDWRMQGRLSGDTDLPLNQAGHQQAIVDGGAVSMLKPTICRCGPEQATKQTAAVIAHEIGIRFRAIKELREMDLGHWEGLTIEEFRDRFPKVDRQWRAEPTTVEPPEGESILVAAHRLIDALRKVLKRHPDDTIAVVVGQFAHAVLRCRLEDAGYGRFWDHIDGDERWREIQVDPAKLAAKG